MKADMATTSGLTWEQGALGPHAREGARGDGATQPMTDEADIMVCGTGSFAARILCDLAATAPRPITVAIVGRNAERLAWLRTAANARAVLFGRPAMFVTRELNLLATDALAAALAQIRPAVLVQAA